MVWSVFLLLIIHGFCYSAMATQYSNGNKSDYEALLAIKIKLTTDPFGVLRSWNHSSHFCKWQGITCGRRHMRVTAINLSSKGLFGSISPFIGNLSFLRRMILYNNSLHGQIPSEIGRLFRLRTLSLNNNSLTGHIPSNLSRCSNLQFLLLYYNRLQGKIPAAIGDLFKLRWLLINDNSLQGQIPDSIGNLSSLELISARDNLFEGAIPDSFGQLKNLTFLGLSGNNLSGVVPPSLYNLSSITTFSLSFNQIHGKLPSNLGLLFPNLQEIDVRLNHFSGPIPVTLSNASKLEKILLAANNFTGQVPRNFGSLQNLSILLLFRNKLGTGGINDMDFFTSLVNCTKLSVLDLGFNGFGGLLPIEIANLSIQMTDLAFSYNRLSGTIPSGIGNLVNLEFLLLPLNHLVGSIPSSIGLLQKLRYVAFFSNKLSGEVPSALGNISWLSNLYLENNRLRGTIPSSLVNCKNLLLLDVSLNNLNGTLPKEVFNIPSLSILLNLSHNHFTGSLPSAVENLKNLGQLDVSWNHLSSEIPASLGSCISLEGLFMQHNSFQGSIPSSFSSLLGIQFIDLSHNNLTGPIPGYLERFPLLYLNLSFNSFEGEVPMKGVFRNKSVISVAGNDRLCGGIPELLLPKCPTEKTNKQKISSLSLSAIIIGCCLFMGLTIVFCWLKKKRRDRISVIYLKEPYPQVSYQQILRATDGFSPSNLIGVGSFGSVYKGMFDENGEFTAIKVLNIERHGASRSFTAECDAMRNIRHRNLVRIITSCSSVDFQGNDFKALVYEYMSKGSLETWLHPLHQETIGVDHNLNLGSRLNIAIDVACALDYLHHRCQEPVIHCDLKPSNVLLDDEMTGHVGDFGLARILVQEVTNRNESSSVGVKGTIGYAAPEYGLGGEVSRKGDVYSYGILLLEMITGKGPTDSMFENGLNLHKFASKALSDRNVMEIVDPVLERDRDDENRRRSSSEINAGRVEECVRRMVEIGVGCSMDSAGDRPEMSLVVEKLFKVRDAFQKSRAITEKVVA